MGNNFNDKAFIICVELNNINSIDIIENYLKQKSLTARSGGQSYFKIMEGVYILKTSFTNSATNIRTEILSHFQNNISVFVMKTSIEAAWNISAEADGWLKNNI